MFYTQAAKLHLSPELAWRRMKVIDREVKNLLFVKSNPSLTKERRMERFMIPPFGVNISCFERSYRSGIRSLLCTRLKEDLNMKVSAKK